MHLGLPLLVREEDVVVLGPLDDLRPARGVELEPRSRRHLDPPGLVLELHVGLRRHGIHVLRLGTMRLEDLLDGVGSQLDTCTPELYLNPQGVLMNQRITGCTCL